MSLLKMYFLTVSAGKMVMMSNKHVYEAVCSMVCRAQLLLKWSEQIISDSSDGAEQLQADINTLLKVFNAQCAHLYTVAYLAFFNDTQTQDIDLFS